MPLALRAPADRIFDTFVGHPVPVGLLRALARGTSHDGAFVCGPQASGKSHLLLACVDDAARAGRRAAYVALAAARGRLRDLLAAQEGGDLVALDGVDAVAGERDDEVALFDFHNRARASGCALVYAARAAPAQLALVLPDLRSRLAQCTQLPLEVPDDALRRDVLRARAAWRGLAFDDAAFDFLLRRVDRDLVSLIDMLERLDRASLAAQRRITVPFLREVLAL
nr:DnaA regulatory inactivator Hda [Chiayiivirga flava]